MAEQHAEVTAHIEILSDGKKSHHETFITKYIFIQDHKTISKQFLITGMIWAAIDGFFSDIFETIYLVNTPIHFVRKIKWLFWFERAPARLLNF
jgi:hypothetical protein